MRERQKRFPLLGHIVVFCLIGLFAMSPVIWVALANAQQPGAQIGLTDLMAGWGVMGWLVMAPVALGPLLFLFWTAIFAIHLLVYFRRKGERP
ncbi:hypothetical protein VE26_14340 [Devosia chinhatensis]|uniref:Uncharacterized protein n=1 Tax=Devosia chinhatensis TaxID=429727 RepID=A0A0F5FGV6_9HYPH|nr:hypothetical protein VE26_14340 [Devosia chinhatensis]